MHALLFTLVACSGSNSGKGSDDSSPSGDDSGTSVPQSTFRSNQYQIQYFAILEAKQGKDWDADGEIDNKLPSVLNTFDMLLAGDLSKGGLNKLVANGIAKGQVVALLDCAQEGAVLTIDLLTGTMAKDGTLGIDEDASYDSDGTAKSHLVGAFSNQTDYEVGPAPILVSVVLDAKNPPVPFPVEDVTMTGALDDKSADGFLVGIVPVDRFVDEVLPQVIDKKGYDMNGNKKIESNETQKAIIAMAAPLLEASSDVQTSDGRSGISAAFAIQALPATF